jgi:hypothetical protein
VDIVRARIGALNLPTSHSNVSTGKVFRMIHDVGTVGGFSECIIANAFSETN